jgi:hypothetical protein
MSICKKVQCGSFCNVTDKVKDEWFANPTKYPGKYSGESKPVRYGGHRWKRLVKRYGVPPALNNQRRVIYVGYWLSNDNISSLVEKWKSANITHVILTFITQIDVKKPLSDAYSMTLAYKDLTPENKNLLKSNFVLGCAYGGSGGMPNPYSLTFGPGAYYENNPQKLAQDLVGLCGDLDVYYDLNIEYINDKFDECANFLGNICKELRTLNPNCTISHSPQGPYFTSQYGNVYNKIYTGFSTYFNFFNIQYYNNGVCNTFEQLFITAPVFPQTAVLQLINSGIAASYIVVGKPVNGNEGGSGYIPLIPDLVDIMIEAFADPRLAAWCQSAGVMIWYYNTQNTVSSDNDNILSYMSQCSYLS